MESISQEVYEQVRAQVVADLKAERLAQSRENTRVNKAARQMFDELKAKYMPKLITNVMKMYPNRQNDHYWIASDKFDHITQMALSVIGERDAKHAYRNGKTNEAVQTAEKMLQELCEDKAK